MHYNEMKIQKLLFKASRKEEYLDTLARKKLLEICHFYIPDKYRFVWWSRG